MIIENLKQIRVAYETACHWCDRMEIAEQLMDVFHCSDMPESISEVKQLLLQMICDDSWQVRKIIADHLSIIPDNLFDQIAGRLSVDSNGAVKRVALQKCKLRRNMGRDVCKQKFDQERLAQKYAELQDKVAPDIFKDIMELNEDRYNMLAGAIAHDMKSIFTLLKPKALKIYNDLKRFPGQSVNMKRVEKLIYGLGLMETYIDDMVVYTRPLPTSRRPEKLSDIIKDACRLAKANVDALGYDSEKIVVTKEFADGVKIRVSKHLIVFALSNIIKNAYESFMQPGGKLTAGKIHISSTAISDEITIKIEDDGMGMSEENLAELLMLVPRRRNKAKLESTGYGIPIAFKYIEAHGGRIEYQSKEQEGTTVTITLPRKARRIKDNQ